MSGDEHATGLLLRPCRSAEGKGSLEGIRRRRPQVRCAVAARAFGKKRLLLLATGDRLVRDLSGNLRLSDGMLPAEVVYDLAGILKLSDKAFIVGGQALNLWAERYSYLTELADYGPYTSKDLDYFGFRQAAEKLADALGGTVRFPNHDDHTPQTAIVTATLHGETVEIDFLNNVKGVNSDSLQKQAIQLRLTVRVGEATGRLLVPIMHPLHCLQSRLSNVVDLGRNTDLARRQLEASSVVLGEYLSERLDDDGEKHVTGVLQSLHQYLLTDLTGKKAHRHMRNDPARILDRFIDDDRIDERWRRITLTAMSGRVRSRRTAWGAMLARAKDTVRGRHQADH